MRLFSRMCNQLRHKIHQLSNLQMLARLQPKMLWEETSPSLIMLKIPKRTKMMTINRNPMRELSQLRKQRKWILPSRPRPLSQQMAQRRAPTL